jgi:2-oxoglutarate ferredoxin oxidoreductase subunit alpha
MEAAERYCRYALKESGISPRALPGQGQALVKACSDEHDEAGHMNETADMRDAMVEKRHAKLEAMRKQIRPPRTIHAGSAFLVLGWGSTKGAMEEAVEQLRSAGLDCGGVHFVDLWPFPNSAVSAILSSAKHFFVVEQNRTAQLGQLIRQQTGFRYTDAVLKTSGRPLQANEIFEALKTFLT